MPVFSPHAGRVMLYLLVQVTYLFYGPCLIVGWAQNCVAPPRQHREERTVVRKLNCLLFVLSALAFATGVAGMWHMPAVSAGTGLDADATSPVAVFMCGAVVAISGMLALTALVGMATVESSEAIFSSYFSVLLGATLLAAFLALFIGSNVPFLVEHARFFTEEHWPTVWKALPATARAAAPHCAPAANRVAGSLLSWQCWAALEEPILSALMLNRFYWVVSAILLVFMAATGFLTVFIAKRQLLDGPPGEGGSIFANKAQSFTLVLIATLLGAAGVLVRHYDVAGVLWVWRMHVVLAGVLVVICVVNHLLSSAFRTTCTPTVLRNISAAGSTLTLLLLLGTAAYGFLKEENVLIGAAYQGSIYGEAYLSAAMALDLANWMSVMAQVPLLCHGFGMYKNLDALCPQPLLARVDEQSAEKIGLLSGVGV